MNLESCVLNWQNSINMGKNFHSKHFKFIENVECVMKAQKLAAIITIAAKNEVNKAEDRRWRCSVACD